MVKILGFLTFYWWGLNYKGAGDLDFQNVNTPKHTFITLR